MPTSGSQNVCLQVYAFDIGRERRPERMASVWKISVHVTRNAFEAELVGCRMWRKIVEAMLGHKKSKIIEVVVMRETVTCLSYTQQH